MSNSKWNDRVMIYIRSARTAEDLKSLKHDLKYQYADNQYKEPTVIDGGGNRWQTEKDFVTHYPDLIRIFEPKTTTELAEAAYREVWRRVTAGLRALGAYTFCQELEGGERMISAADLLALAEERGWEGFPGANADIRFLHAKLALLVDGIEQLDGAWLYCQAGNWTVGQAEHFEARASRMQQAAA